jgi:nucleoside recognition membrane protein YjiH
MSNDKAQITKEIQIHNTEYVSASIHLSFDIHLSFGFWHLLFHRES